MNTKVTITQDEIEALTDMADGWELEEVGTSDFFNMAHDLLGETRARQFTEADYNAFADSE